MSRSVGTLTAQRERQASAPRRGRLTQLTIEQEVTSRFR